MYFKIITNNIALQNLIALLVLVSVYINFKLLVVHNKKINTIKWSSFWLGHVSSKTDQLVKKCKNCKDWKAHSILRSLQYYLFATTRFDILLHYAATQNTILRSGG